jgi:hypothetical protein
MTDDPGLIAERELRRINMEEKVREIPVIKEMLDLLPQYDSGILETFDRVIKLITVQDMLIDSQAKETESLKKVIDILKQINKSAEAHIKLLKAQSKLF